jgi:hypothetical protein
MLYSSKILFNVMKSEYLFMEAKLLLRCFRSQKPKASVFPRSNIAFRVAFLKLFIAAMTGN